SMYEVAAKAASRAASSAAVPPAARPACRNETREVPAYSAASPRAPSVTAVSAGSAGAAGAFGASGSSVPAPPATLSCQRPELAGRTSSTMPSGTLSEVAAGNPRAAMAAGASTTRSIHSDRCAMSASRSRVSHQRAGRAGPGVDLLRDRGVRAEMRPERADGLPRDRFGPLHVQFPVPVVPLISEEAVLGQVGVQV